MIQLLLLFFYFHSRRIFSLGYNLEYTLYDKSCVFPSSAANNFCIKYRKFAQQTKNNNNNDNTTTSVRLSFAWLYTCIAFRATEVTRFKETMQERERCCHETFQNLKFRCNARKLNLLIIWLCVCWRQQRNEECKNCNTIHTIPFKISDFFSIITHTMIPMILSSSYRFFTFFLRQNWRIFFQIIHFNFDFVCYIKMNSRQ